MSLFLCRFERRIADDTEARARFVQVGWMQSNLVDGALDFEPVAAT
jgi:hypothetical protein